MSGIDRRGEGIRRALAGEQPVKPSLHLVVDVERPEPSPVRRRHPRLLLVALACWLLAVWCFWLVWGS